MYALDYVLVKYHRMQEIYIAPNETWIAGGIHFS